MPENAYVTIKFHQLRFDRRIHVALGPVAHEHCRRVLKGDVVLTWEELVAVKQGVVEAGSEVERALRLVDAINYFARAQGVPELAFYGATDRR